MNKKAEATARRCCDCDHPPFWFWSDASFYVLDSQAVHFLFFQKPILTTLYSSTMVAKTASSKSPKGGKKTVVPVKKVVATKKKIVKEKKPIVQKHKNVDEPLVNKAVAALLQHHEKASADSKSLLGTDMAVQVQIGLEIAPKSPSPKPLRIMIPYPIVKVDDKSDDTGLEEPEVCLIVKEESKEWVTEMIAQFPDHMGCIKKVLGLQSLRTKHAQFQQRRELLHKYTHFMADDRILPMLTKALGKSFMKAKKQPIPIALTRKEALPFAIHKALSATFMTLKEGTCVTVRAGNTGMPADKLAANICAIMEHATEKLPRKWANVRSIAIKTPESVSLPIYNKTPEELVEIGRMAGLKTVWKDSIKEHTSTTDKKADNDDDEEIAEKAEKKRKADKLAAKSPLVKALKKQKQKEEEPKVVVVEEVEKVADKKTTKKVETPKKAAATARPTRASARKTKETPAAEEEKEVQESPTKKAKTEPKASDKKRRKSDEVIEKKVEKEVKKDVKSPKKEVEKKVVAKKDTKSPKKEVEKKVEKVAAKKDAKSPKKEVEKKVAEKSPKKAVEKVDTPEEKKKTGPYIASKTFKGSKKGYVFRAGSDGVGYYKDVKPVVDKMALEAISRMQGRSKGTKSPKGGKRRSR
jgi:ribosome biogenesis protein UTP30